MENSDWKRARFDKERPDRKDESEVSNLRLRNKICRFS